MTQEYFHEAITVYYTVSVILSIIGTYALCYMATDAFIQDHAHDNENVGIKRTISSVRTQLEIRIDNIQTWITHKRKRKEAPEDDSDYPSFSLQISFYLKRGGFKWKNNLYSLLLKNIVA